MGLNNDKAPSMYFSMPCVLPHDSSKTIQQISAVDLKEMRISAWSDSDFPNNITFGLFVTTHIRS